MTASRYGKTNHKWQVWLLQAGLPSMGTRDLDAVNEVLSACTQHTFNENRPTGTLRTPSRRCSTFTENCGASFVGLGPLVRTWKTAEPERQFR